MHPQTYPRSITAPSDLPERHNGTLRDTQGERDIPQVHLREMYSPVYTPPGYPRYASLPSLGEQLPPDDHMCYTVDVTDVHF